MRTATSSPREKREEEEELDLQLIGSSPDFQR